MFLDTNEQMCSMFIPNHFLPIDISYKSFVSCESFVSISICSPRKVTIRNLDWRTEMANIYIFIIIYSFRPSSITYVQILKNRENIIENRENTRKHDMDASNFSFINNGFLIFFLWSDVLDWKCSHTEYFNRNPL